MTSQTGGAPSRGSAWLAAPLAYMLIAVGALALIDAGVTLVWQEPITALYALLRRTASAAICARSNAPRPRHWSGVRWRTYPTSAAGSRIWLAG